MSWNDYVQGYLVRYANQPTGERLSNVCENGALVGTDGTVWAATPGFALEKYSTSVENGDGTSATIRIDEFSQLSQAFTSAGMASRLGGIRIHREKYYTISYDSEKHIMYLRKENGGACIAKTNICYVIATFSRARTMNKSNGEQCPQNPGATNRSVEELQNYLISNNL